MDFGAARFVLGANYLEQCVGAVSAVKLKDIINILRFTICCNNNAH